MANPPCTFCGEYQSVLMDTNLITGDSQCPCGNCLPMYALTFAATMTTDMPKAMCEALGNLFDQIAANDKRTKPAATSAAGKSTRAKRAATADAATDAPAPEASSPPEHPGTGSTAGGPQDDAAATIELPEPCDRCGATTATGDAVKLTCDGCGHVLATAADIQG